MLTRLEQGCAARHCGADVTVAARAGPQAQHCPHQRALIHTTRTHGRQPHGHTPRLLGPPL
eukprot:9721008-Alexandrium_andersonii.AAC.1